MSIYKRGGIYYYDFLFQGERHKQSTRMTNKTAAERIEAMRKAALAEGRAGLVQRRPVPSFR